MSEPTAPAAPRRYLDSAAVGGVVVQALVAFVIAALALSRSADGTLTATALAAIVAGAAFAAAATGWPAGLFAGAHDALAGAVADAVTRDEGHDGDDDLARPRLWRRTLVWAGAATLWATAAAILVAAALQGRRANLLVAAIAVAGLAGVAGVVVDTVARAAGVRAAAVDRRRPPRPRTLRRRAWAEMALPMAGVQAVVNAGAAWLLFRDYAVDDPYAARALTRDAAMADVVIIVGLVTVLFGFLAGQWGRVDAAVGRVAITDDDLTGVTARSPLGRQGLVYLAIAAVLLGNLAGLALSPTPSLLSVAIVRALFAGSLTFLAVGVAHVRGALNTVAGVTRLPVVRRVDPATVAPPRAPRRPRLAGVAGAVGVVVLLAVVLPAGTDRLEAEGLGSLLTAEAEAFAVRVEYDIPLPASAGTIPHVVGEVRRTQAGENAKGIAASPSHFDAVVAGQYYDPDKENKGDENRLPQAECFFPGDLLDTEFRYPTETRAETEPVPATSYSTARCGEGPTTELHVTTGTGPQDSPVTAGASEASALLAPVEGTLRSTTSATSAAVSILDVVKVGSVEVEGASSVTGRAGEQATESRVALHDVDVAGTRFSVADDRILLGDQAIPLGTGQADAFFAGLNTALLPTGCTISAAGPAGRYPQGFLFARPEPEIGVADDGSFAASMRSGLLVVCELPQELTGNTDFNPQRVQVLLGFVYTSARTGTDPGGFSLGDLATVVGDTGGLPLDGGTSGLDTSDLGTTPTADVPTARADVGPAPPPPPAAAAAADGEEQAAPARRLQSVVLLTDGFVDRWPVWVVSLVVWLVLTHLGITRLLKAREELGA